MADFQQFGDTNVPNQPYYNPLNEHPSKAYISDQYPEMLTPNMDYSAAPGLDSEFDEPPLLEELEIYPDRIMEKILAVLNPFHSHSLADDAEFLMKDSDLAGPVAFCLTLAVCLFVSGNKAHFGYIYGLSVMSCLLMYCLLSLMSTQNNLFTLTSVASILGYCLLPVVGLSVLGIIFSFNNITGIVLSVFAVIWASLASSRLFVAMSGDQEQRPLIAYPCALVYGVFALLVVF